ncbi:hypothetical protein [Neogemmobacter tilapiae]|nr:hypothetical protein [Gemmobacter tilapiae]
MANAIANPSAQLDSDLLSAEEILGTVEKDAEVALEAPLTAAAANVRQAAANAKNAGKTVLTGEINPPPAPPVSVLSAYRQRNMAPRVNLAVDNAAPSSNYPRPLGGSPLTGGPVAPGGPTDTSALNQSVVQSIQFTNAQAIDAATAMIVTPADQMIGQAAGLAALSSAQYYDSMTKVVLAAQTRILQKITQDVVDENYLPALEDSGILAVTEILLAGAMAVAAAGGAMEAASAGFAIGQLNKASAANPVPPMPQG